MASSRPWAFFVVFNRITFSLIQYLKQKIPSSTHSVQMTGFDIIGLVCVHHAVHISTITHKA